MISALMERKSASLLLVRPYCCQQLTYKRQQGVLLAQLAKGHTSRVPFCIFIFGSMEKPLKKHWTMGAFNLPLKHLLMKFFQLGLQLSRSGW